MEVLVGPTFSIEVSSPEDVNPAASAAPSASTNCIFLKDDGDDDDNEIANHQGLISSRLGSGIRINDLDNNSTDSSSSIGAPDDSDDEGAEVDSGSSSSKGALASFDSLEDSLPIKSGLSNHFAGKSKSFTNLSDVMSGSASTVKDLVKPENPFNKRRRILMANKWCTRRRKSSSSSSSSSSFYTWSNPKSMPLLALPEDQEEEDQHQLQLQLQLQPSESEEDDDEITAHHKQHLSKLQDRRMFRTSFMSHSCFSLTDLQEDEQYQ